jgi:hypothetical protein
VKSLLIKIEFLALLKVAHAEWADPLWIIHSGNQSVPFFDKVDMKKVFNYRRALTGKH